MPNRSISTRRCGNFIALGIAVTLRCDGCINAHTDAAIKADASKEDVIDALGVATMVNAGAARVYSARTIDAYETKAATQAS